MKNKFYDAVIIGGGASGLMCAISAKKKNKNISVAIIERNDRVGRKILSTGNGRCNLTNRVITQDCYTGSFSGQLSYALDKISTERLLDIFQELGLEVFCDSEGRYYPVCKQASAVNDVLRFACERLGVDTYCNENINSVKKIGKEFCVKTEDYIFKSRKLVAANGSKAAPKLGGNGSGADILKNFGHSITPFYPALCPVKVKSELLKALKGIRATGKVKLIDKNGDEKACEAGEIQFTENALSGICVFNLSLYCKKGDTLSVDLLDNISYNELFLKLTAHQALFSDMTVDNLFTGIFIKRLGQAVLKMSGIKDFSRLCSQLTSYELKSIAKTVKTMQFSVIENCGFEQAQCARGGVLGKEIDENTMQSRLVKGLYICGEVIDICGKCGGYNLHFAFSSGYIAGENL